MNMTSTFRLAREQDREALDRLLRASGDQPFDRGESLATAPGRRYVLVIDDPDGHLVAGLAVRLDAPLAHLDWLAIHPEHRSAELERRMLSVAEALCEAYQCSTLDVQRHAA